MMTTHKLLLAASAAFLLVGCTQDVTRGDIYNAASFCEDKGGINHLHYTHAGDTMVTCQNGDKDTLWSITKQRQLSSSRGIM